METIPGLSSASATVLREHARRLKQATHPTPNHSLAGRLKRKFQQMAQHHYDETTNAAWGFLPTITTTPPPTLSPETLAEFQRDVTATVLHWLAKALQMDPQRLEHSTALRELLQPYTAWMGNAPHWMQFTGLLAAKKCQEWSGIEATTTTGEPSAALALTYGTLDPDRWMSSPSDAPPVVNVINVDREEDVPDTQPILHPDNGEEVEATNPNPAPVVGDPAVTVGCDEDHSVGGGGTTVVVAMDDGEATAAAAATTTKTTKKRTPSHNKPRTTTKPSPPLEDDVKNQPKKKTTTTPKKKIPKEEDHEDAKPPAAKKPKKAPRPPPSDDPSLLTL